MFAVSESYNNLVISSLRHVINSNTNNQSIRCLHTVLKLIYNILSQPNNPTVRMVRRENCHVRVKILQTIGGLELLKSIGFRCDENTIVYIVESVNNEVNQFNNTLLQARSLVETKLRDIQLPFNPYQTTQMCVNPQTKPPQSTIVDHLQTLTQRYQTLEDSYSAQSLDRQVRAFRPGQYPATIETTEHPEYIDTSTDHKIILNKLYSMQKQQQRQSNYRFNTQTQQSLQLLQQAKLYSHVQLVLCFPDQTIVTCQFHPKELISHLKKTIQKAFLEEHKHLDFVFVQTPPHRILNLNKSFQEEKLVPASKLYIIWNHKFNFNNYNLPGYYLKEELFQKQKIKTAFPTFQKLKQVKQTTGRKRGGSKPLGNRTLREEKLLKRMLGMS